MAHTGSIYVIYTESCRGLEDFFSVYVAAAAAAAPLYTVVDD